MSGEKISETSVIVLVAVFFVTGLLLGWIITYNTWQSDSKDRIAATGEFAQAFMIAGYEVVPAGENSFKVVNFANGNTEPSTIFIDAHNITKGKFIASGPNSNKSNMIDISDGLVENKVNAYRLGIERIAI